MSENPDYLHADEPARAEQPPDFSPDFFDDVAEPSPLTSTHVEESVEPVYPEQMTDYNPGPDPLPASRAFPVVFGVLMVAAIGAAILFNSNATKETPAPAAPPAAPPAAAPAAETPAPGGSDALAGDVKSLKGEIEKLTGQLKDLSAKVDGLPKPTPPADLKPIQAKIDDLTKTFASVEGVSEKLDKIDTQVKSLDSGVKSATDKVSALSADVKKAADAAAKAEADAAKAMSGAAAAVPAATTAATPTSPAAVKPDEDKTASDLAQGADLFKAGKYKEADEVFKKLADSSPKDARVYYYAALANGMTTGGWQTSSVKIATTGAELEKSGATKPADVDAAFSGLSADLKPWLAYFRKLGK